MTDDNQEQAEANRPPQETVSFTFDRMTVARFRETFPNARWSDRLQAWTVPGKTARKRIERWLALEAERWTPYDEERGRDAFEFEPILSPYLQVFDSGFRIRTPYSKTVVDELRQVPFARWNGDDKNGEIPFASYDDLQHRWETIEEAAKRSEPEERRKRAEARRGTEEEAKAKRRTNERNADFRCRATTSRYLAGRWPQQRTGSSSSPMCRARSSIRNRSRNIIRSRLTSMCGPGGDPRPLMNSSIPGQQGRSPENTRGFGDGGTRHSMSSEKQEGPPNLVNDGNRSPGVLRATAMTPCSD